MSAGDLALGPLFFALAGVLGAVGLFCADCIVRGNRYRAMAYVCVFVIALAGALAAVLLIDCTFLRDLPFADPWCSLVGF